MKRASSMNHESPSSFAGSRLVTRLVGLGLVLALAADARAADLYWSSGTTANSLGTCTDGGGSWQASSSTSNRWFNPLTGTTQFWGSSSGNSSTTVQIGANNGSASTAASPITIGSTGGSNFPQLGGIVFSKASSGGYFLSAGVTTVTSTSQLTINATGANGIAAGTGIVVNADVVGDTTFMLNASGRGFLQVNLGSAASQTWTNNSPTYGLIINSMVAGAGKNLTTNGVGTVTLAGTNTFNNLTVGAGTLKLTDPLASGTGSLTVNGGATLSLLAPLTKSIANSGTISIGAGGGLTAAAIGTGALSLAGVTGTTAGFTSTSAATLAPASVAMAGNAAITLASATAGILASGAATISGTNNVLSVGGVAAAGNTYTLLSGASLANTGAITLTGAAVGNQSLALGSTGTIGRTTYTFGSTATALQLGVSGTVYDMFWSGGASGVWDYTTANWQKDGTGSTIVFVQGDAATIGTASTITVDSGTFGSSVQAASLTVNNAAGTVALSGSAVSVTGTFGKSAAGDLTVANPVTVSGGAWLSGGSMTTSGSLTVTAGGLNVGGGSLTANAATTVTAGGLNVTAGSFTSNAATTVSAGGVNVSGGLATLNNPSTLTGGIAVTGGTAAFNAANTVSGAVAASGGGAISMGSMSGVGAGTITLDNGTLISTLASSTLTNVVAVGSGGGTVANASGFTLAGNVTGTSGITAAGPGELVLSGSLSSSTTGMAVSVAAGASARLTGAAVKYLNNTGTVNGGLTFDNATLVMRTPAAVSGTGSIVLVGTTTISGSTGVGATASITTPITGSGGLVFNGASSRYVILGGSNAYSGGTQLNGDVGAAVGAAFGTGSVTSLGTGARINNTSGGLLVLPNNLSTTSTTTNVLAFTGANPIQITGTVTGAGILRASSSGIIDITQQTASTMQATGSIDMGNGAMIRAASASNFGSLAAILASGTPAPTLQALGNTGAITQPVRIGANSNNPVSFTVDTNGFAVTLAGVIQNLNSGTGGGITKAGGGTLTLTAANTYTGATAVSAGNLLVNGSLDPASAVTVASAAALGGSGTIGGSVLFSSGANFAFDPATTLTINGASVTFGGFGVSSLLGVGSSTPDGTYTLMSGLTTFDLTNVSNVGSANAFSLGGGKTAYLQTSSGPSGFQLVVVPEPTTVASAACGMLLALLVARRGGGRRGPPGAETP